MNIFYSDEMMGEARKCKTPEELILLAEKNNVNMTEAEAINYFALLNPSEGNLSDEELEGLAGGGCDAINNDADSLKYKIANGDCMRYTKGE